MKNVNLELKKKNHFSDKNTVRIRLRGENRLDGKDPEGINMTEGKVTKGQHWETQWIVYLR